MQYAEIDNLNNTIVRELNLNSEIPFHKYGLDKKTRIIPINYDTQPSFNEETQFLSIDESVIYEDQVLKTWKIETIPPPSEVPLWAFRAILNVMGLASNVEQLINSLEEPQKTIANIQWNYGNFIERNHPLIDSLGSQIGLDHSQIDYIFREASKLK